MGEALINVAEGGKQSRTTMPVHMIGGKHSPQMVATGAWVPVLDVLTGEPIIAGSGDIAKVTAYGAINTDDVLVRAHSVDPVNPPAGTEAPRETYIVAGVGPQFIGLLTGDLLAIKAK